MSTIPANFVEIKHIYDFLVSPGAYYFDTVNKTIHSGKKYKYNEISHRTFYYESSSVYLQNSDYDHGMLHICSFTCTNPKTNKKQSFRFEYDKLIEDIENHPEYFFEC